MEKDEDSVRFLGYPQPREGPEVPYSVTVKLNPVLRGIPLVVAAAVYASSHIDRDFQTDQIPA